jgi:hypothetical protein
MSINYQVATIKMSACEGLQSILGLLFCDIFDKRKTSVTSKLHRQPEAFDLQILRNSNQKTFGEKSKITYQL